MVVRAGLTHAHQARRDPLLLTTALLGLTWNLCAMAVYELPRMGVAGSLQPVAAAGFSALGLLPAVVVHSVLRGERDGVRGVSRTVLVVFAYALSMAAAGLQFAAAFQGEVVPSSRALRLLTYAFVALVVPVGLAARGQPGVRRALWVAALAVFAVSAMHLSRLHTGQSTWPVELLGHNASVPLALAILYQDYPFAFADLFLKRALVLIGMVGTAFAAIGLFGSQSDAMAAFLHSSPLQAGRLVTVVVGVAFLYPAVRALSHWFVDVMVLRRPDYSELRREISQRLLQYEELGPLLDDVCRLLAPAVSARTVAWRTVQAGTGQDAFESVVRTGEPADWPARRSGHDHVPDAGTIPAATVLVPTSDPPRYAITLGGLTGGRRLLSDDLHALEAIAVAVARRIDAIRVAGERYERERREVEMRRLTTEAELRALRAQINPHFLFNALTTIGYLIQTAPPRALATLLRLTSLLRAVLRSEGAFTTLGRELETVEAYLDIEQARFEERLQVRIDVPIELRGIPLPPLVLQPIAENAVKHGIAPTPAGGEVRISARLDEAHASAPTLLLVVQDTGVGASADVLQHGQQEGLGLRNVQRRLHHHYGEAASLSLRAVAGQGTVVEIRLPVPPASARSRDIVEVGA
jgi:signal transduction histidine kinase